MNLFKLVSASSMILGVSFVLRFALTLVLARFLSPHQLGVYSWSVTAFGIAGIVTNFGLDFFLIRKIPEYRNALEGMVGSVIRHTKKQVNINTLLIISLVFPISYFSTYFFEGAAEYNRELMVILLALPFAAYLLIYSTSLRSFDFPLTAQSIESLLQTGIFLSLVLVSFTVFSTSISEDGRALQLVSFFVCSWIISCFIANLLFKKNIGNVGSLEASRKDTKEWRKHSFTILLGILGWSFLGRSDVLLLGFLVSPAEVAAYFICLRLAEILTFFSGVSYYVWGGEISNLVQEDKWERVQYILTRSSQLCCSATLIIACFGFIYAEHILAFVNDSYQPYAFIFRGALLAFFLKGASGILNPMYYIIGQQDFLAKCQWAIGLCFLASVLLTVPSYGITGCLIAFVVWQAAYVLTLGIRLKVKHNLSILPI